MENSTFYPRLWFPAESIKLEDNRNVITPLIHRTKFNMAKWNLYKHLNEFSGRAKLRGLISGLISAFNEMLRHRKIPFIITHLGCFLSGAKVERDLFLFHSRQIIDHVFWGFVGFFVCLLLVFWFGFFLFGWFWGFGFLKEKKKEDTFLPRVIKILCEL